jgi:hypothetical protein
MRFTAKKLLLLCACVGAGAFPLAAAEGSFRLPPETAKLKAGAGVEFATASCLLCHSADYISTQPRLTEAQWRANILKMQAKYGAPIKTNQIEALVSYFAKNYGTEAPPVAK